MTDNSFSIDLLSRVLDVAALRHRVIAHNVANVNTPGYRRLAVEFEDRLAMELAHPEMSVRAVQPRIVIDDGPARVDGNTVDIDREMNELTKNALLYQAATQILIHRLGTLRAAIAGRSI